jgi:hypothetical protein
MTENERFGLVFTKTGSINSGTEEETSESGHFFHGKTAPCTSKELTQLDNPAALRQELRKIL